MACANFKKAWKMASSPLGIKVLLPCLSKAICPRFARCNIHNVKCPFYKPTNRIIRKVLSKRKVFVNSRQTWVFIKKREKRSFDKFDRQFEATSYMSNLQQKEKLSHIFQSSSEVHMYSSMPSFYSPIPLMSDTNYYRIVVLMSGASKLNVV
jgi:hypothetical protein